MRDTSKLVNQWQHCPTCSELAGAIFGSDDRHIGWECTDCRLTWTDPNTAPEAARRQDNFDPRETDVAKIVTMIPVTEPETNW